MKEVAGFTKTEAITSYNESNISERFLTEESAIEYTKKPFLEINCNVNFWRESLKISGVTPKYFLVRIFEKKSKPSARDSPGYTIKIIPKYSSYFSIDIPIQTVSKATDGVFIVKALDEYGAEAKARKWSIEIKPKSEGASVLWDYKDSPTDNSEIPFQYSWYTFDFINSYGKHDFTVTIKNEDLAGNQYERSQDFTVSYARDLTGEYENRIAALRASLLDAEYKLAAYETISANNSSAEAVSATAAGDKFEKQVYAFNGAIYVSGTYINNYNEDGYNFLFNYNYNDNANLYSIKNVTITIYDKRKNVIRSLTPDSLSDISWDGTKDGKFVITSNTRYRIKYVFTATNGEKHEIDDNYLTTGIIINNAKDGLQIAIPGINFPGNIVDILKDSNYIADNIEIIYSTAAWLRENIASYDYLLVKGYANWTTYPANGEITAQDKRRMDKERPSLLDYSKRRAESVKKVLVRFGVPENKIRTEGTDPDTDRLVNPNSRDNHKNRRVEFFLKAKDN
jgi:hypothetical protein